MSNVIQVKEDSFGSITLENGKPEIVRRFTFTNPSGTQLQIINYGATITSFKVPDRNGKLDDIVLGFDTIEGYLSANNPYFGATIGRVCNRIGKGRFKLDGKDYQLGVNNGENHLHGGTKGFDKKMWDAHITKDNTVVMSYVSQDGEEEYPGNVLVNVTFKLCTSNELIIKFQANATKPTPISLTNHSYFNLSGHQHADKGLKGHYIHINADSYTPIDANLVTTGEILPVAGTKYDLRPPSKNLNELLSKFPPGPNGYDNNFCLNEKVPGEELGLVAVVQDNGSGRMMMIYSDQPGVQLYTSNFLPDKEKGENPIQGKEKADYWKHGALCLETQNFPNAVNHGNFPNPILHPGEIYRHQINYKIFTTV